MQKNKSETTLEGLSSSGGDSTSLQHPTKVRTPEEQKEWHAQFWVKLILVSVGLLITLYAIYVATCVLIEYQKIVVSGVSFPSGVALMVLPIFVSGLALILSASKLLSKPDSDDSDKVLDRWLNSLNPVLRAISLYLRSKSNS